MLLDVTGLFCSLSQFLKEKYIVNVAGYTFRCVTHTVTRDPIGSRRYWIVEINEMINNAAIREHRDEIFRAAYTMKLYGDAPYLTPEESVTNEQRNISHKKVTLLEEAIEEIVHNS